MKGQQFVLALGLGGGRQSLCRSQCQHPALGRKLPWSYSALTKGFSSVSFTAGLKALELQDLHQTGPYSRTRFAHYICKYFNKFGTCRSKDGNNRAGSLVEDISGKKLQPVLVLSRESGVALLMDILWCRDLCRLLSPLPHP